MAVTELKNKDYKFDKMELINLSLSDDEEMTAGEFIKLVDSKLETDEQKNSARKILDEIIDNKSCSLMFRNDLLTDFGMFIKIGKPIDFFQGIKEKCESMKSRIDVEDPDEKANVDLINTLSGYVEEELKNIAKTKKEEVRKTSNNEESKGSVKKITVDNIINNAKTAGKKDELIKVEDEDGIYKFWNDYNREKLSPYFPEGEYTKKQFVETVEKKLENNNQKNAFRAMINAFTENETDNFDQTAMEIAIDFLLSGEVKASAFIKNIAMRALPHTNKQNTNAPMCAQVVEYAEAAGISLDGEKKKKQEKAVADKTKKEKSAKKSDVMSEATREYTKSAQIPDLSNRDEYNWLISLPGKAKAAKGKMNSNEYNAFYDKCKEVSSIAKVSKWLAENKYDEIKLDSLKKMVKDNKMLSKYVDDRGMITADKIRGAYEGLWNELRESATAYVKFKLDKEGFTRDPKIKPGHALKRKSVEKFKIMDEVFGHSPRDNKQNIML